eukprot:3242869-Rhodomonas_salina.3
MNIASHRIVLVPRVAHSKTQCPRNVEGMRTRVKYPGSVDRSPVAPMTRMLSLTPGRMVLWWCQWPASGSALAGPGHRAATGDDDHWHHGRLLLRLIHHDASSRACVSLIVGFQVVSQAASTS